jgi:hypothetical protein
MRTREELRKAELTGLMIRPQSSRRYHGCTPGEAQLVRADRERLARAIVWAAIGFLLASFAPHFGRMI